MAQPKPRGSHLSLVREPGNMLLPARMPISEAMRALSPQKGQRRDITRMHQEGLKRLLAIEIDKIKTAAAEAAVADLTEHATSVFDGMAERILERKELPRSPEHQTYYNEFSTLMLQLGARDLAQIHTAGAASIMRELLPPTYVEYEEPSWLDKLLGRE